MFVVNAQCAKCGLGVGDVWLLLDKSGKQEVKQCTHINCVKLPLSQFLVLTNAQIFLHNTAPGNGGFQSTNHQAINWGSMKAKIEGTGNTKQEAEQQLFRKRESIKAISGLVAFGPVETFGNFEQGYKCVQWYEF